MGFWLSTVVALVVVVVVVVVEVVVEVMNYWGETNKLSLAESADKLLSSGRVNYRPYRLAWLLLKLSANREQGWKSVLLQFVCFRQG